MPLWRNMKLATLIFTALSLVVTGISSAKDKKEMASMKKRELKWFETKNCQKLTIRDYAEATANAPKAEKVLVDAEQIKKLMDMIEALPTEGEMMISFSPTVPMTVLRFECDSKK